MWIHLTVMGMEAIGCCGGFTRNKATKYCIDLLLAMEIAVQDASNEP